MTSISRAVLVFIGAWGLAGCAVPFQVKRITSKGDLPKNAVLYSLPRAKIVVEIPVTREKRDKAVCVAAVKKPNNAKDANVIDEFKQALKTHGLDDWSDSVPKFDKNGTRYKYMLTADQAPTLALQAEPDPDAVFAVDVASEKFKRKSLALTLSEMGVLEAGGVTAEDATTEVVVEVVATVVTIAVMVSGLLDAGQPESDEKALEHCRLALGKLDKLEKRRLDIVKERDELLARAKVSSDPSKALATAKLLLDNVKAQKDELLDLFRGVVVAKEMAKVRCEVTPSAGETDWDLLTLRGATLEGANCAPPEGWKSVEAAATAAAPGAPGTGGAPAGAMPAASGAPAGTASAAPTAEATPTASAAPTGTASSALAEATPSEVKQKVPGSIVIKLQLTAKSDRVLELAKESESRYDKGTANPATGFVYRVPARTSLKLSQEVWGAAGKEKTSVYSTTDALIPQMGVMLALPAAGSIKNTKANYSVAVHPASGAAKEIKIEYGTKDVPNTSTLAKDAAPLLDRANPHKRLEKEKAELELEQKIFELRCAKAKREGIESAECKAAVAKAEE